MTENNNEILEPAEVATETEDSITEAEGTNTSETETETEEPSTEENEETSTEKEDETGTSTEGEDSSSKEPSTEETGDNETEDSNSSTDEEFDPIIMPENPEPEVPEDTGIYRVYALVNSNGQVISINSDAFLTDGSTGWVKIDEGTGDRYHHAQNNYMGKPLWCEGGPARYKYVDGEIVERSQEEIDEEIASFPEPEETNEDLLMETAADHEYRICLLELGLTEEELAMLWEE